MLLNSLTIKTMLIVYTLQEGSVQRVASTAKELSPIQN